MAHRPLLPGGVGRAPRRRRTPRNHLQGGPDVRHPPRRGARPDTQFPTDRRERRADCRPDPRQVVPTILLPPTGSGTPVSRRIAYIDFDDVRDPETGEITSEVAELLDRLDSYTEVSASGTGLHVLVFARLPDEIGAVPGDDLDEIGSIEIYDHGRFFGGTWRHVEGTPTEINARQEVVDELVERCSKHRLGGSGAAGSTPSPTGSSRSRSGSSSCSGSRSPYYSVDLTNFADPSPVEETRGNDRQGAHPYHGKKTGGAKSLNYNLDTVDNCWHCFAHQSGGGAMEMAAIMAEVLDCRRAGTGALRALSDDDFLRTCIYARDNLNGFTTDMAPPYRALVAVARRYDLPMRDRDEGILGPIAHSAASAIYDELSN